MHSSYIFDSFEKELRAKLLQKSTSFQSEEAILLKNFRFFDLNNSGTVEFPEFLKAVEKIGIQTFDEDVHFSLSPNKYLTSFS